MRLIAVDHVQLAMPAGREAEAEAFYVGLLGLEKVEKPEPMQGTGGIWFALGRVQVHLGVEAEFRPARKAHPAFRVAGVDAFAARCEGAGHSVEWDERYPGYRRFYVHDPFGNRLELLERVDLQSLHIRRYTADDAEPVRELHAIAMKATGAFFPGPWNADFVDIEGTYLRSGGEFLVGELEGRVVAMGALLPKSAETVQIKRMRVLPEHQRQGFGQIVLDRLEARARKLGFARIELDTTPQQVAAQQFYLKNGYRQFDRRPMGEFDLLLFEKRLANEG